MVSYAEALTLQQHLVEERRADHVPDLLLILQHPSVITIGVNGDGDHSHIVATSDHLQELGVAVHKTGRGGNVTYHGPGQVVVYPILNLHPDRRDVHQYVRDVEEVMIRVCAEYGIVGTRIDGLTGVWVGDDKIGAIGVRISRWITSHGLAFNVNTNLDYFRLIIPCGIEDRGVTSLQKLTGQLMPIKNVEDAFVKYCGVVFDRSPVISMD
jgi:lipoyl(octanoyl) transferase